MARTPLVRSLFSAVAAALLVSPALAALPVRAATLGLRSSSATVAEGATFTVRLSVNTQGKAINNAEATITYPRDLVEAVSASRGGSIFRLWIVEPSISAGSGTVTLNGGIPTPGFSGSGELASVTFRARRAGTATIGISGAAVRENDGLGTDILTGAGGVTVTITPAEEQPERAEPPQEEPVAAAGLTVWSPTHPNQGTWYTARNVVLGWNAPAGTRAMQVAFDESPSGGTTRSLPAETAERSYDDVADGIWYFHVRAQTSQGWTRVTTFPVRIDATAPQNVSVDAATTEDGRPGLSLRADDETSGVQYYEVQVDGQPPQHIPAELAKHAVAVGGLTPGQRLVTVSAYDNAGNRSDREESLLFLPTVPPKISYVVSRGRIVVTGTTVYPNSTVTVALRSPSGELVSTDVPADGEGRFSYRSARLRRAGSYQVWAKVTVAISGPASDAMQVQVGKVGIGMWLRSPLPYLVVLLLAAAYFAVWNLRRYMRLRRLRRQPADAPTRGRRRI